MKHMQLQLTHVAHRQTHLQTGRYVVGKSGEETSSLIFRLGYRQRIGIFNNGGNLFGQTAVILFIRPGPQTVHAQHTTSTGQTRQQGRLKRGSVKYTLREKALPALLFFCNDCAVLYRVACFLGRLHGFCRRLAIQSQIPLIFIQFIKIIN